MNKELEAFERIITQRGFIFFSSRMSGKTEMARKEFEQRQKDIKCVEKALKKYNRLKIDYEEMDRINDELNLSNHQLRDENIKLNKALEIIKKKRVNTQRLFQVNDAEEYNMIYSIGCLLTQEEYELLKEVLKDERTN